jgi:indole-3-glycerol phosphate synthase
VLLIVAAPAPAQLADLHELARGIGLDVLVEVHSARELEIALALDNPIVGINNRDLHSFHTTLETTFSLLPRIGDGRLVVTESGIQRVDDVLAMRGHGVNAFLVGEAFMRAADPGAQLRALFD